MRKLSHRNKSFSSNVSQLYYNGFIPFGVYTTYFTLPHFVIQTKHGIIVKIFILLISGQKWAVKFKKQGLNPWYERNL